MRKPEGIRERGHLCLLCGLLGIICAAIRVPSASACSIVDATASFWSLAARSAHMTPAAEIASFRADVVERYPELYTAHVLGRDNVHALDTLSVLWLKATRKNGIKGRAVERELVHRLPIILGRFKKAFPDFLCNFPIYLMASLGSLDGAGRVVAGHPALVLGVDTMAEFETAKELPVVITHELFHRYNFQVAGFSDDPGDRQAIWRTLWAEGLATYVSGRLNPKASLSEVLVSEDLAQRGPDLIRQLAVALRVNDAPDPSLYAEYFESGSARAKSDGIPQRSGYYVGYRVVQQLAKRDSLYELAHLKGPSLHHTIDHVLGLLAEKGAQSQL